MRNSIFNKVEMCAVLCVALTGLLFSFSNVPISISIRFTQCFRSNCSTWELGKSWSLKKCKSERMIINHLNLLATQSYIYNARAQNMRQSNAALAHKTALTNKKNGSSTPLAIIYNSNKIRRAAGPIFSLSPSFA